MKKNVTRTNQPPDLVPGSISHLSETRQDGKDFTILSGSIGRIFTSHGILAKINKCTMTSSDEIKCWNLQIYCRCLWSYIYIYIYAVTCTHILMCVQLYLFVCVSAHDLITSFMLHLLLWDPHLFIYLLTDWFVCFFICLLSSPSLFSVSAACCWPIYATSSKWQVLLLLFLPPLQPGDFIATRVCLIRVSAIWDWIASLLLLFPPAPPTHTHTCKCTLMRWKWECTFTHIGGS